jgi:hypothetical protein
MKTLKIENLENVLNDLKERSKDLITYGNTNERNKGWGMLEVIEVIKFSYTDSLKDKINDLMVSYLEGGNYRPKLKVLTNNVDKYELVLLELREYYKEFLNAEADIIILKKLADNYIKNIITILNK